MIDSSFENSEAYWAKADFELRYSASTLDGPTFVRPDDGSGVSAADRTVPYHRYSFVAPVSDRYQVLSEQDYDGYLLLYEGFFNPRRPSLNLLAFNDDFGGGFDPDGDPPGTSRLSYELEAGQRYIVVTTSYDSGSAGLFTNTITRNIPPPPPPATSTRLVSAVPPIRMSVAPPPGLTCESPPPLNPPELPSLGRPPTYTPTSWPGVSEMDAVARPPPAAPPPAPRMSKVACVTPGGTIQVWGAPVKEKVSVVAEAGAANAASARLATASVRTTSEADNRRMTGQVGRSGTVYQERWRAARRARGSAGMAGGCDAPPAATAARG